MINGDRRQMEQTKYRLSKFTVQKNTIGLYHGSMTYSRRVVCDMRSAYSITDALFWVVIQWIYSKWLDVTWCVLISHTWSYIFTFFYILFNTLLNMYLNTSIFSHEKERKKKKKKKEREKVRMQEKERKNDVKCTSQRLWLLFISSSQISLVLLFFLRH